MTYDEYILNKEHIDELIVGEYFSKYWKGKPLEFDKSGISLVDKINLLCPDSILDVGCGENVYKNCAKSNKFLGIDPYNSKADLVVGIEDYAASTNEQFDVVLVLGSINFGPKSKILREFTAVNKLTKSGGHIFVRVNPGITHTHTDYPLINHVPFYQWTEADIQEIASTFNYQILELEEETNRTGDRRLFFHYYK